MDKKSNVLESILSIKVIIYTKNKLSFCSIITNWEWVLMMEVISRNKKKDPMNIMFKRSDINQSKKNL